MNIKLIHINIWDDFLDPGDTDLYIEMSLEENEISHTEAEHVYDYIISSLLVFLPKIQASIQTYQNELSRINLDNISHDEIEQIITLLHNKIYKNFQLNLYSES